MCLDSSIQLSYSQAHHSSKCGETINARLTSANEENICKIWIEKQSDPFMASGTTTTPLDLKARNKGPRALDIDLHQAMQANITQGTISTMRITSEDPNRTVDMSQFKNRLQCHLDQPSHGMGLGYPSICQDRREMALQLNMVQQSQALNVASECSYEHLPKHGSFESELHLKKDQKFESGLLDTHKISPTSLTSAQESSRANDEMKSIKLPLSEENPFPEARSQSQLLPHISAETARQEVLLSMTRLGPGSVNEYAPLSPGSRTEGSWAFLRRDCSGNEEPKKSQRVLESQQDILFPTSVARTQSELSSTYEHETDVFNSLGQAEIPGDNTHIPTKGSGLMLLARKRKAYFVEGRKFNGPESKKIVRRKQQNTVLLSTKQERLSLLQISWTEKLSLTEKKISTRCMDGPDKHPAGIRGNPLYVNTNKTVENVVDMAPNNPQGLSDLSSPISTNSPRQIFIVSNTLLVRRNLTANICRLCPLASFLERDFALYATSPTDQIVHEVDVILSPSSGLVMTSLQKLHSCVGALALGQRSLLRSLPPFYVSLLCTASKYGVLYILVQHIAGFTLGAADCSAIAQLAAFARSKVFSGLKTQVHVLLVPGSDNELASWAARLMAEYGSTKPHRNKGDLRTAIRGEEETQWELWLRRAGLNAFIAREMLDDLGNEIESGNFCRIPALARLLAMGRNVRAETFSDVALGAESLMEGLSDVLDLNLA